MKILITGGHLTPALATIQELHHHKVELVFVGRRYSGSHGSFSVEQQLITNLGLTFISFDAPKLHTKPAYLNFIEAAKTPLSLLHAHRILKQSKPDVILSFGGYLALPLCTLAFMHHIPIIIHEQTQVLGKTNQLIARFAHQIALSWPNTHLPPQLQPKTIVTGNPIRSEFLTKQSPSLTLSELTLQANHHRPLIYITGGNQGAHALNQFVLDNLDLLTQKYTIVHQCGHILKDQDYQALSQARLRLSAPQLNHYWVQPWYDALASAWLTHHSDLVISRAGANTITELLLAQTPVVLIPLPYSALGEQEQNARLMQQLGLARHLPQSQLSELIFQLPSLLTHKPKIDHDRAAELSKLHRNAAKKLAGLVLNTRT